MPTQTTPDNDELRKITGIGNSEEQAMEDRAITDDMAERSQLNDATGGDEIPFNNSEASGRVFITKKRGIIGGIIGLLIGGSMGTLTIVQGPAQFLQFSNMLQDFHFSNNEDFVDGRTARLMYQITKGNASGAALAGTRLGGIQNKFADRAETRLLKNTGLRSVYDQSTGRLIGYEIDDLDKAIDKLPEAFDSDADFSDPAPNSRALRIDGTPSNNPVIGLRDESFKNRREFTRKIVKATGRSKIGSRISSRLLTKRGGVKFSVFEGAKRRGDNFVEWASNKKKEIADRRANGASDDVTPSSASDTDPETEGSQPDPEASEAERAAREAVEETVDVDVGGVGDDIVKSTLKSKLTAAAGGAAAAVGVLCTLKGIGDNATELKHTQVVLPMIRTGMDIIIAGSQIQGFGQTSSTLTMDELAVWAEALRDPETGASWAAARSVQAENGTTATGPDLPDHAKPGKGVRGESFFDTINSIPGLGTVCNISNIPGEIPGIKQVGEFATSAITAVIPIDEFVESVIGWFAGEPVDTNAKGPDLGNIANYGARLAANDKAIATGGRELSGTEVAELDAQSKQNRREEFQSIPLYARLFDITNYNSLMGTVMRDSSAHTGSIGGIIQSNLFGVFGRVSSAMGGRAYAQGTYNYGFSEYGFSASEKENEVVAYPLENAAIVEPNLSEWSKDENYGKCFGTKITESGAIETNNDVKKYDEIDSKCKSTSDENLLRYRFYLTDMVTAHSLACYEGVDESSCSQLGFGSAASTTTNNSESQGIQIYSPALQTSGDKITPKGITLHWWGDDSGGTGIEWLANVLRDRGLAVQFGITSDGKTYQMTTNEDDLAAHAIGANSTTFGIEIEGGPDDFGASGPTDNPAKFNAVVSLVKHLVTKYQITTESIGADSIVCDDVVGIHPHKAYNKCGNTKSDVDDAYFNAVMEKVRSELATPAPGANP